jgi:type IV pilus assembly protein PilV
MNATKTIRARQSGFTMIEVLVSLLIIVLGLLGLAGMQVRMQQAEFESYQRTQALVLLYDMVDRINVNRSTASCFALSSATTGAPFFGVATTITPACGASGIAADNTAANTAMTEWNNLLQGATESGGAGAMVGARGCVSVAAGVYTVAVAWQGTVDTSAPKMDDGATTINCANGEYGAETRRRAVSTTFRMATLD